MSAYNNERLYPEQLVEQLMPTALRRSVISTLPKAMLSPVDSLAGDYSKYRSDKRFRLSYNGQVRLLENVINRLMIGSYDMVAPVIYLSEPTPVEEFLISPDGNWERQGLIHYDVAAKAAWDAFNDNPTEPSEAYGILHDHTSRPATLGFEVHLTPPLAPDAPAERDSLKELYLANGGNAALRSIVDTYKLAGKRYVVIQDE